MNLRCGLLHAAIAPGFLILQMLASTTAAMADQPLLVIEAQQWLVDQAVAAIAPSGFDAEGVHVAVLPGAIYCGAQNGSGVALILLGQTDAVSKRPLTRDQCNQPLTDIISKQYDKVPVGVARLLITSLPYKVSLKIDDVAAAPHSTLDSLTSSLKAFSTSFDMHAVSVESGFVSEQWSLLLKFGNSEILIGAFPTGSSPSTTWDQVPTSTEPDRLRNTEIFISHSYLSGFMNRYRQKLVFDIPSPSAVIAGLNYSGVDHSVAVSANVHSNTVNDDAETRVDLSGDDLRVTEVTATPQLENCNSMPIGARPACQARNVGHRTFATAVESFLKSDIGGKYLRPSSVEKPISLNVFNSNMQFRVAIDRAASSPVYLVLSGGAAIEKH